jgi:hypothetical protein
MSYAISERTIVVAAAVQVSCDLAGEAAILTLQSGVYFGLNAVGVVTRTYPQVWGWPDGTALVRHRR